MSDGLRLAKGPERLACGGIDRDHLPPRCGDGVEHAVDVDRGGPRKVVEVGSEIIAPPDPGHFEVSEVAAIDLVQGRGAGVPGITAEIAPLAVVGAGQALRERGGRGQHHDDGSQATHEGP